MDIITSTYIMSDRKDTYKKRYFMESTTSAFGINPYKTKRVNSIIVIAILIGCSTAYIPMMINLYYTLCEKDYDGIFEDFPQVGLVSLSICKILNIHSNQLRFKKLFELIMKERQLLKSKEELLTLDKMSKRGKKLANLYAKTLVTFLMIFLSLPLYNPLMDVISPLNETRPRQHIYRINYVLFDEFEYFYMVYLHLTWNAVIMIFIIIVIDLLYINVIYHACGLFAVCGYRIMKTTENCAAQEFEAVTNEERHEDFKGCVSLHHETLRYYNLLNNTCRNLYLIQMGLNIVLISITAVKVVMYLHQADQAIRAAVFLAGQQFHLYIISLPGQLLLDQSLELSDTIYASIWYETPVAIQKMLHMMQIRSSKPSILTAAGLYEMKIENFGITVKTCVSYCTMFLSLRN